MAPRVDCLKEASRALRFIAEARRQGCRWAHPLTTKLQAKRTYVVQVGDYFVGVGAYK
ncbi:MAG TPA: hypothetical protein VE224_17125 [Pseudolabrys sp.]|nr:hypothetical protein [Pseudolabrys sp.]